ncbi:MAG: right-handed parallel beta-helix repeat-containing protein [Thermoproteota archaeon]
MKDTTVVFVLTFSLILLFAFSCPIKTEPQWENKKHGPICINGDKDFKMWSIIVSGDGSRERPYVLENLSISSIVMNGIEIWNTSSYFVIRNLVIEGNKSHAGICLYNVKNVKIENCELHNNSFGIMVYGSSNVTIVSCRISNGTIGVFQNSSSKIVIKSCRIFSNDVGIYLKLSSNGIVDNCTLSDNKDGIMFDSSSSSVVANCTILKNYLGILLYFSSNNTIFNNRFSNEVNWNIVGNHTGNKWNITKTKGENIIGGPWIGGNSWSDYTGADEDKDGIGDTQVPHGPGDYLPLVKYGNMPPKADFFHFPLKITCIDKVYFSDNSTDLDGRIISWLWDFGDGENATGRVVMHIFKKRENYTVRLTVKDDEGLEDSCEKVITVYNSPPIVNFTYSPKEPHSNENITFISNSIDPDGRIVSWMWLFGDGCEGYGESITHAYAKEGNYTVSLIVRDDEGEINWLPLTIAVKPTILEVKVYSERGVITGAGKYVNGSTVSVSISPTAIPRDFFTNYVFEGWKVNGSIVSTSSNYSFAIREPVTLVASWRIELNIMNVSLIVMLVLIAIIVVMWRKR